VNLMDQNKQVSLYEQTAYELRGIVYVPHYRNNAIFVGPGYPRHNVTIYTAADLLALGAVERTEFLWQRGTGGRVTVGQP
jgi:coproporphyrinogen III oxidase-like Fe-S oxidoreductase